MILVMTCLSDVVMVYSNKRHLSGMISALIPDDTCNYVLNLYNVEISRRHNGITTLTWHG